MDAPTSPKIEAKEINFADIANIPKLISVERSTDDYKM